MNKWEAYEELKKKIKDLDLTSEQYETIIKIIVEVLKIWTSSGSDNHFKNTILFLQSSKKEKGMKIRFFVKTTQGIRVGYRIKKKGFVDNLDAVIDELSTKQVVELNDFLVSDEESRQYLMQYI